MKRAGIGLLVVGTSLALTSCSAISGSSGSADVVPMSADAPAGFEQYYSQTVDFQACEAEQVTSPLLSEPKDLANYQCATLKAPLDWDNPDSDSIELAVARYKTDKSSGKPVLFYNMGGPGGDAVQSLSIVTTQVLPEEILSAYQILALDPRGVGESTPIRCWGDAEKDEFLSEADGPVEDASAQEIVDFAKAQSAEIYASCKEKSGDIVDYVDTPSAAKDFDMVRAVMGQEKLDYLGFSYGTFLGATYAELFPDKAGRLVLDGALDPAMGMDDVTAAQAKGMEESLYNWIEICQEGNSCPLSGDLEDGKQQMIDFLAAVDEQPLTTSSGRELTGDLARTGIIGSLYSEDSYQYLTMGMNMAMEGDGSVLLILADSYNGRNDDGTFNNMQDAFTAINSLDYPVQGTVSDWELQAKELEANYPVFGSEFTFGSASLTGWGVQSTAERDPIVAAGSPEILVVGTTHDPATPYVMAENLSSSLENGVLVTVEGWDHTAYSKDASSCIQKVVNSFLIDGEVPSDGVVCSD